ncbi:HvfC/BufC N-terminal domain-containing protein [Thalassococcus lentus]|uniref:DNA-binding domain-containing protein n=1 Tax=Thalassococcus lentus TaxID=1210524 RepID=A0ABT4XXX7_9RHOB|nr:DNA-binding domain-containing protein [Thalassococcus lentus]MDA7426787.1 DNA-binding domain-containing protein [Thalassococcus lentus]
MITVSQDAFRAGLLDARVPVPEGLKDNEGRSAGRRYAVYRNNVAVSLREALETGFPAVASLLGKENFAMVAGHFLRQSPPASPLMMHYGEGFPAFLEAAEPLAHIPYLGDIARLELAQRASYHAADCPAFDPAVFQDLSDGALMAGYLVLAPATKLVKSRWPMLSIYRYATQPGAAKPGAAPENVLITRPEFDPVLHPLDAAAAGFVQACLSGGNFGAALEAAGPEFDLPNTLSLLLSSGAIAQLKL